MDSDDVIDYMVMEAVAVKVVEEDKEAEKKAKIQEWRQDRSGLDKLRGQ